ncbi:hypothetical protein GWE18_18640 [Bradyrhizobium sp. CSA112]|uniref:hypothetical protein n=1 Tax=Bradyrhizobium sp. CSA112 TaxID=2699170 RepID=UPI0023B17BAF|nr:hypothetical protein [Bradyrhizobium sp. CSA112]MDE5454824.1 hypothetical protein [Bradyrhizobium sp. CSA112]
MSAKLVFILAGTLVVGGCNLSSDPTVFPYSKDQVQTMLVDAKTTLPRRDGPGEMIKIWGAGRSAKGVKLNMKYASWAPLLECEAIITSITPKESRVVADCGKSTNSDSAMSRTQGSLRAPMFEEHIAATLNKRAFNRSNADRKETAAVFQNLPGMQREALQMSADEARQRAAERSR